MYVDACYIFEKFNYGKVLMQICLSVWYFNLNSFFNGGTWIPREVLMSFSKKRSIQMWRILNSEMELKYISFEGLTFILQLFAARKENFLQEISFFDKYSCASWVVWVWEWCSLTFTSNKQEKSSFSEKIIEVNWTEVPITLEVWGSENFLLHLIFASEYINSHAFLHSNS